MPLYLAGHEAADDHYSYDSLHASKDDLEEVTPDGAHQDVARKDAVRAHPPRVPAMVPPSIGLPADRDSDFARDAASVRAIESVALAAVAAAVVEDRLVEAPAGAPTRIVHAGHDSGPGPGPEIMAADTLQGDRVMNRDGELLGKIRDIMLDVRRGRIAYAVMSSGGVVGFGDRLYALPWSALTLDAEQHCFVLDISRERLRAAPGFDRDCWPSMADASFTRSVHDYYGRPSYLSP